MLCPRCNKTLPDGSVACNFCGLSFQELQNEPIQEFNIPYLERKKAKEESIINESAKPSHTGIKAASLIGMIFSIIGVLLAVVSVFPPFFVVKDMFNTLSENIFSPLIEIAVIVWITCGIILSFSFAFKKCSQGFAITRLIVSILGFGLTIFLAYKIHEYVDRQIDTSTVFGNLSFNYGPGFYLMMAGFMLCIVAAIISLVAGPNK